MKSHLESLPFGASQKAYCHWISNYWMSWRPSKIGLLSPIGSWVGRIPWTAARRNQSCQRFFCLICFLCKGIVQWVDLTLPYKICLIGPNVPFFHDGFCLCFLISFSDSCTRIWPCSARCGPCSRGTKLGHGIGFAHGRGAVARALQPLSCSRNIS